MKESAAKVFVFWAASLAVLILTIGLALIGRFGLAIASAVGLGGGLIRLFRRGRSQAAQDEQSARGKANSSLIQSRSQALDILGLGASASSEDIDAAYKRLIQKLHPDHGGTEYLTKQLNAARDFLLKKTQ